VFGRLVVITLDNDDKEVGDVVELNRGIAVEVGDDDEVIKLLED